MIVYKYGGTSLIDEEKLKKSVKEALEKNEKIIIVTSAIGRYPSAYATDTLLKMADYCNKDEVAMIASCGEIISSVRLSNMLKKEGLKAIALSVYDIDLKYDKKININDLIISTLKELDIVIIPGFIYLKNNKITLFERGGSNITASFLASYFKCDLVIISDIDGIYSKNPKEDSKAIKLTNITYRELEIISEHAPSFFPKMAIKYLEEGNVKVYFKNINDDSGTIISKTLL